MTTGGTVEMPLHGSPRRLLMHAAGNVFLGFALGLLSYYLITDLVTRREQDLLRAQLSDLGAIGDASPDRFVAGSGGAYDWEGWGTEDLVYWESLAEGGVFGRLVIEAMDLDSVVLKGTTRATLARGPGWVTYTDLPGPTGNAGISAHRTPTGGPFRRLGDLKAGDTIHFYSPFRRYTYVVTDSFVVTPDRVDVLSSTQDPRLTLTACDPPQSGEYRMIVWSKLVEVRRLEDEPVSVRP